MAPPYTIPRIEDVPATSAVNNIILGLPGQRVDEASRIEVYATRESVDVSFGVTLGQQVLIPEGSPANINTVVGSLPSIQDDLVATGAAEAGMDIIVSAANVNAAAQEMRVFIKVVAFDDLSTGLIA